MKKILVIGATSAIAQAAARLWAAQGNALYLLGRDAERVATIAADLSVRGAVSVGYEVLDLNDTSLHAAALTQAAQALGELDIVLIAHGTLGNQDECERDFAKTLQELNTNAISVISLLTHLANRFEQQKHGSIAVISSVAGDRGRQSNYVYGTAKGAVTLFMQGLRNRLHRHGVNVVTIKPGLVDTPMTASFTKGPLWVGPDTVGRDIVTGIGKRRDVIYSPGIWLLIMTLIKLVPERIFKKTDI